MKSRRNISFLSVVVILLLSMTLILSGCLEPNFDPTGETQTEDNGDDSSGGDGSSLVPGEGNRVITGKIFDYGSTVNSDEVSVYLDGNEVLDSDFLLEDNYDTGFIDFEILAPDGEHVISFTHEGTLISSASS